MPRGNLQGCFWIGSRRLLLRSCVLHRTDCTDRAIDKPSMLQHASLYENALVRPQLSSMKNMPPMTAHKTKSKKKENIVFIMDGSFASQRCCR